MRSWSLTSRLVGGVLAVVMGCLVLLDAGLVGFTRFEVTERLDNSLQEVSERLQSVITLLPHTPQRSDIAWLPGVGPRTLAYQIMAADGRMILRSQNAPERVFVNDPQTGFADSARFRVYVAPATSQGYRVLVGEPLFHRRAAVRRAILLSIGPTLFLLPVMWFLIRWIIRRGMRRWSSCRPPCKVAAAAISALSPLSTCRSSWPPSRTRPIPCWPGWKLR